MRDLGVVCFADRNSLLYGFNRIHVHRAGRIALIRVCRVGVAALVFAALGSVAVPAVAQTALEDSVKKRPRTGFSPIGLVVGPYDSFLFFPKFETVAKVTDNLFADTVGKKADLVDRI
jgi:hypothetical protein